MKDYKEYYLLIISLLILILANACQSSLPEDIEVLYDDLPATVDFNFHVKPILSDKCLACHGPDDEARKANLRLDLEHKAFSTLESGDGKAFKKGHAMGSVGIQRMLNSDPDEIMPPPESNLSMSKTEIAMISKWIDQGAEWKDHWAFTNPVEPVIPTEMTSKWANPNEIDYFTFRRLKDQGLSPSSIANKERLLRRVYLDLTGLPPSLHQIDEFIADESNDAFEHVVDKLLTTNANAERLTMEWLDVARYADSHGLHADGWRSMWPWRDWVIKAFKQNMPYDHFVTEQLAGDLFDNPTKDQIIATAFNRNHTMTAEGGAIDEEWRLSYVFDRAETFSTAFLGLTMNCAKCHDHKYDPISQDEYYQLTAFFNNVRELGMTGDDGNYGPTILLTDKEAEDKLDDIRERIMSKETELGTIEGDVKGVKEYIKTLENGHEPAGLVGHFPLDSDQKKKNKDGNPYIIFDENIHARSNGKIEMVEGKYGQAVKFDTDYSELYLQEAGIIEAMDPFSFSIWINTNQKNNKKTQYIAGNSSEKNSFWRGWEIELDGENKVSAQIIHSKPHNLIHIKSKQEIPIDTWTHIGMTYDGSSKADGMTLYVNGIKAESDIVFDKLYKSTHPITSGTHVKTNPSLRIGKSGRHFTGEAGIFVGSIDDIKFFDRKLTPLEMSFSAGIQSTYSENEVIQLAQYRDSEYVAKLGEIRQLREEQLSIRDTLKEVMVMEESDMNRKTYVYHRGEYTQVLHEVGPETPSIISNFPDDLSKDRLGLAKWLFQTNNPLTARVTVNRYWQMIFGKGLVKTPQDFGLQGAKPSHPQLLDYLAIEFVNKGWDIKWLLKKMVMSATYKQNSIGDSKHYNLDPDNIYLARGPSYRLPAEMIRDNALFASGLISETVGGESVRPYQPEGLWIEKNSFSHKLLNYKETKGDSLYRRSMYTFIKRTSPHPMMTTFDAPNREVCTVKREQTNTPLQSLVLMNDPQFVEAAKALSQRMQLEGGDSLDEQLSFAFRSATSRKPKAAELALLSELYYEQFNRFSQKKNEAEDFLKVGEMRIESHLEPVITASLAMVANAILNHDETYIKR